MFRPLAGIRILDLSRLVPGAAVTHRFADLGADVVKVEEPPVGDYIREVQPQADGVSLQHLTLDRNKRSICLSLREAEGVAVLHALVREADAVVESSRPGTMARRQADHATLSTLNPRLVYLSYTGYGQDSRYAHLPSHGSNLAAFAAVNPIERRDDGVIVHGPMGYGRYRASMELAALQASFVLLAALLEARATGVGRHLDISLVHTLMAGDYAAMTDYANNGGLYWQELAQPTPKYAYYECSDGKVLLLCAIERRFWISFCEVIGRPDLAERGDWSDKQMDFGGEDVELYEEVERTIRERPRAEWLERLIPEGIPCSPVNSIADALADPDLGGRLFTDQVTLPSGREVTLMAPPVQTDAGPFRSRPAPTLGRDTSEVLADFAVPADLIAAAQQSGALPAPATSWT
jgi:crotonobetainyl-CoA:carnitine CoA-transferase CaiB-like acyl-CoA transferase